MTSGVIFDCDGVLVDSEPLSNQILAEMLTEVGLPTSTSDAMRDYMGASTSTVVTIVQERLERSLPAGFLAEFARRCEESFTRELRPVAGIEAALDGITVPVCVASSGSHEKIRFTLARTGLLDRFEGRIFSVTEVARGKPAPDIFLYAASRMGFAPSSSLVVEDTPRGVRAGVAAGMPVLAYADNAAAEELTAAGGRTFREMAELPALVDATLGLSKSGGLAADDQ